MMRGKASHSNLISPRILGDRFERKTRLNTQTTCPPRSSECVRRNGIGASWPVAQAGKANSIGSLAPLATSQDPCCNRYRWHNEYFENGRAESPASRAAVAWASYLLG